MSDIAAYAQLHGMLLHKRLDLLFYLTRMDHEFMDFVSQSRREEEMKQKIQQQRDAARKARRR